ncbi:MAG: YcxB family protein [Anaerolineaceae bacterium]|nr:YcxB family protein [Anaerolineaceae bacterium]
MAIKTPIFVVLVVVTVIIILGSLIGLVFQLFPDPTWNNVALVSLLVGGFYVVYYFIVTPAQLTKKINQNEALKKERKITFGETEVDLMVGRNTSRLPWENFVHVLNGRQMYIMVYEEEKKIYPFLPKRAFTEPDAEKAFLQMLDEHEIPLK